MSQSVNVSDEMIGIKREDGNFDQQLWWQIVKHFLLELLQATS